MRTWAYLKRIVLQILTWMKIKKRPQFSDYYINYRYVLAGCAFADRISEIVVQQEPMTVEAALLEWETAENEYLEAGYRSLPIDAFMDHTMWGVPLKDIGVKRVENEPPMHHAKFYRLYVLKNRGVRNLQSLFDDEGFFSFEPTRRLPKFHS